MSGPSVEGDIQHLLGEDDDIAELGVDVIHTEQEVILRGQVNSAQRRDRIVERVSGEYPDLRVRCEITVTSTAAPDGSEHLPS